MIPLTEGANETHVAGSRRKPTREAPAWRYGGIRHELFNRSAWRLPQRPRGAEAAGFPKAGD